MISNWQHESAYIRRSFVGQPAGRQRPVHPERWVLFDLSFASVFFRLQEAMPFECASIVGDFSIRPEYWQKDFIKTSMSLKCLSSVFGWNSIRCWLYQLGTNQFLEFGSESASGELSDLHSAGPQESSPQDGRVAYRWLLSSSTMANLLEDAEPFDQQLLYWLVEQTF